MIWFGSPFHHIPNTNKVEIPVTYQRQRSVVKQVLGERWSGEAYGYTGSDRNGTAGRAGVDLRYSVNPDLKLLGSYNPDFANVAQGLASIDFSYAERLREERRPFFLEGIGSYTSPSEYYSPFVSVRIDDFDFGGKFYGKLGRSTNVGLMSTEDVPEAGKRNDSVATLRQQIGKAGQIQGQFVSRAAPGQKNEVGALSAQAQVGRLGLHAEGGRSWTDGSIGSSFGGSATWSNRPWTARLGYHSIDNDFLALDGFVPFVDERGFDGRLGWSRDYSTGVVRSLSLTAWGEQMHHFDGTFFRENGSLGLEVGTSYGVTAFASGTWGRFEQFHDHAWYLGFRKNEGGGRSYGVSYSFGEYAGETYARLAPFLEWSVPRGWISISSETVQHGLLMQQNVVEGSYQVLPNTTVFGRLVQKNRHNGSYLAVRHALRPDLDVVGYLGDPNSRNFEKRFILKLVWRF